MFDFDNMESFFGKLSNETSKPSKKAGKEAREAVTDADSVDLDTSDDSLEESSLGEMPAKVSAAKSGKSSKVSSLTGDSPVTLPCHVYARDFKVTVEQLDTCTINGLLRLLVESGYVEIKSSSVNLLVEGNGSEVYVTSPSASPSDLLVNLSDQTVTICAGMLQMELSAADFSDLDVDEISVNHLSEKWGEINPQYADCGMSYDRNTSVAIPVISGNSLAQFKLPFYVNYFGTKTEITEGDFLLKETVTSDDLTEYLFPNMRCHVEYRVLNGVIYPEFKAKKSQKVVGSLDRKEWQIAQPGSTAKPLKAAVKYTLPFNVYFVNLGITMPLEAAMFGGRNKLTKEDVLEYLKPSYAILRNQDREVDCFFSEESNTMSVALVSGKKGASALADDEVQEVEGPGLWKLIRSVEEYTAVLKSDNFLGHYHGFETSRRVEATPIGTFVGVCGSDRECITVKSVEFHLKIPKIPRALYDTICLDFKSHSMEERIVQIYWDSIAHRHLLVYPEESDADKVQIKYRFHMLPKHMKLVVTIHSHNTMMPYFSTTDNADEALTGIYGVVGTVNVSPTSCFRVGMEGAFTAIPYQEIFEEV